MIRNAFSCLQPQRRGNHEVLLAMSFNVLLPSVLQRPMQHIHAESAPSCLCQAVPFFAPPCFNTRSHCSDCLDLALPNARLPLWLHPTFPTSLSVNQKHRAPTSSPSTRIPFLRRSVLVKLHILQQSDRQTFRFANIAGRINHPSITCICVPLNRAEPCFGLLPVDCTPFSFVLRLLQRWRDLASQ